MTTNQSSAALNARQEDFGTVHKLERQQLGLPDDPETVCGVGLAFSGGGIRSASFALGILQVLLNEGLLRRFDYLSTVSGGGYLGSAVSWWLHQAATDETLKPTASDAAVPPQNEGQRRYEAFRQQFGSKVKGARTLRANASVKTDWQKSNWLAYIRQHGNYLQPRGVGIASLTASVLRVCLFPLCVYGLGLIGLLSLVLQLQNRFQADHGLELAGAGLAVLAIAALILASWFYGPATWIASTLNGNLSGWLYRQRTRFRRASGSLLSLAITGALIASVPWLYDVLNTHLAHWIASLSSLSVGTLGTVYQFFQGRSQSRQPSWTGPVRLIITAALVIYGLLLGAWTAAHLLPLTPQVGGGALALSLLFGLFVNVNFAGLARLYRDRLMEAFLPDLTTVASNAWHLATRADAQKVSDLKGRIESNGELGLKGKSTCPRPLHLINCNAVLMDSPNDFYRNRGGDNFVISPVWSGSNSTGWVATTKLGDGAMSLPTAMAISGAAANPNAAPNGLGVTRNRLVSFLMSLFNVRLGYWMSNPRCSHTTPTNRPNLWLPGFRQGLLGSGLSEQASYIELTDGGHFDNTALYELVRRRCKLIVVSQGGCDTSFTMEDLANAIEKVRVDFSVFIEFNFTAYPLDALRPIPLDSGTPAKCGFSIGRIRYPKGDATSPDYEDGHLIYLQAVPTATMSADIFSYWRRHNAFPNDTTLDQFFTELNLEAYRELGYTVASECYRTLKALNQLSTVPSEAKCIWDQLHPASAAAGS